jgi:hypothetical protein
MFIILMAFTLRVSYSFIIIGFTGRALFLAIISYVLVDAMASCVILCQRV